MSSGTAWLHLLFLILMLVFLVGGIVAVIVLWFVRGRDPAIGLVAEYVTEPPDDLPPGAAGTLLDEHADPHDVMATLLGLGRDGAIRIDELNEEGRGHDYLLTAEHPDRITSKLERDLLAVLFDRMPEPGESVRLSEVKSRFQAHREEIRDDLYAEMVVRGYFTRSPADTRRWWWRLSWIGLIVGVISGLVLTVRVDPFAIFATVGLVITCIVMIRMSHAMPKKTVHGAECAARWAAFKRYLESIAKRDDLAEARDLFDRYLSYAVAFEIENDWLRSFARVGVTRPTWFGGRSIDGDMADGGGVLIDTLNTGWLIGHLGGGGGNLDLPNVDLPSMPNVDMQGMSDVFGGGLEGASSGLGGLLDAAGSAFDGFDFDL